MSEIIRTTICECGYTLHWTESDTTTCGGCKEIVGKGIKYQIIDSDGKYTPTDSKLLPTNKEFTEMLGHLFKGKKK